MEQVVVGVDPHKLSATIGVVDGREQRLCQGRFAADRAGLAAMRRYAAAWPERTWAVEGANGVGRPLARRLLAAGEQVVDVPAELAARVRLFDTGHNRKSDAHDAHSSAMVAVDTTGMRVLSLDPQHEALRLAVAGGATGVVVPSPDPDRRPAPSAARRTVPGQAKKHLATGQAGRMLASVRHRDLAGKTRRRIAAEELAQLVALEAKMKKATAELKVIVLASGSHVIVLPGVGDAARFADPTRFVSWTGTALLDASSGEQNRHRLSRAGDRRVSHVNHVAACAGRRRWESGLAGAAVEVMRGALQHP